MHSSDALYLFNEGRNFQAYRLLGAHPADGGTVFRVWAPNAERVSVVGDFNGWDGGVDPLHPLGVVRRLGTVLAGSAARQPLQVRNPQSPQRRQCWSRPTPTRAASRCGPAPPPTSRPPSRHAWGDADWLARRAAGTGSMRRCQHLRNPCRLLDAPSGRPLLQLWRELAERLVPYVSDLGYTHIELMPLTEHPLDESWGYQSTGYFAPTSRFGTPDDLRVLHRRLPPGRHRRHPRLGARPLPAGRLGAGPLRRHRAVRARGPAPRPAPDWGTHIFNYGRNEVRSFLLSSAHCWLSEFHVDGLRVDAVASMLYLDYSRKAGEWLPNKYGGRENLEAIDFLRELNDDGARRVPRRADHRRGIDRLADGVAPDLPRRPRLLDEVEHGLDERHAATT